MFAFFDCEKKDCPATYEGGYNLDMKVAHDKQAHNLDKTHQELWKAYSLENDLPYSVRTWFEDYEEHNIEKRVEHWTERNDRIRAAEEAKWESEREQARRDAIRCKKGKNGNVKVQVGIHPTAGVIFHAADNIPQETAWQTEKKAAKRAKNAEEQENWNSGRDKQKAKGKMQWRDTRKCVAVTTVN
jgi:hypothetical protein